MTAVEKRFLTGFRSEDADTPGLVQEDDGTVWLVAPDGTRTQISSGGFMPARNVGQCLYNAVGQPLTLAAATSVPIPWELNQGQAGLLDLSTATAPAPVVAGVYAFAVTADYTPDSFPDPWFLELQTDLDFFGQPFVASGSAVAGASALAVSQTWYCGAASALAVNVRALGGGTLNSAYLSVQRLT